MLWSSRVQHHLVYHLGNIAHIAAVRWAHAIVCCMYRFVFCNRVHELTGPAVFDATNEL